MVLSNEQADVLKSVDWTVLLRGRALLQDIDFEVANRSCFVVLGDSGSGKSMLLRMLSGSMSQYPGVEQSGTLTYMGQPLTPQNAPPMVSMSAGLLLANVFDALLERVRFQQNLTRQEWTEWLEDRLQRWGFPDLLALLNDTVVSLSPLHQRVVAIAREAFAAPALLLVDELTRELDEYDRFVLLDFVRELSAEMAVMLAISNPREARVLHGNMIFLSQGRVKASGGIQAFLDDEQGSSSVMDTQVPMDLRSSAAPTLNAVGLTTLIDSAGPRESENQWAGVLPLLSDGGEKVNVPGVASGPLHLTEHVPSSFGPRGFYWILPGKLAGMPLPGLLNGLDHDLAALRRCRVSTLVSLSQQPVNAQALTHNKLEAVNLPGGNKDIPSLAQLRMMVRAIERVLKQGGTVAVHCVSGNTRTGTVLAAYLVHQGMAVADAIQQVKASNSLFNVLEAHIAVLNALHDCSVKPAKPTPSATDGDRMVA